MQALLDAIAGMDMPRDAQRVFHGQGGLYPGCEHWALDAYPPVWVTTSFSRPLMTNWPPFMPPCPNAGRTWRPSCH